MNCGNWQVGEGRDTDLNVKEKKFRTKKADEGFKDSEQGMADKREKREE